MLNNTVTFVHYIQVYVLHSMLSSSLCDTMKDMEAGFDYRKNVPSVIFEARKTCYFHYNRMAKAGNVQRNMLCLAHRHEG